MVINSSFLATGILVIAALNFVLSVTLIQLGEDGWAGAFFAIGTLISVLFIAFMFFKQSQKR